MLGGFHFPIITCQKRVGTWDSHGGGAGERRGGRSLTIVKQLRDTHCTPPQLWLY